MVEESKGGASIFDKTPQQLRTSLGTKMREGSKVHWHAGSNFVMRVQEVSDQNLQASHNCCGQHQYFGSCECLQTQDCHNIMWQCQVCQDFQLCLQCMGTSTKIYNIMLKENDQTLLIMRIKEAYLQFQALINKKFSQEVESFFFDKEFAKAQSIADKKIQNRHNYVVLGDTKAGKSTLLNKLIGKKILGTNEMRATAAKWTIEFHREKNYKLHVYKEDRDEIKKQHEDFKKMQKDCEGLNDNNKIEKISISMYTEKVENLELKLIDLPGLNDQAKAIYINTFIDKKKEVLNPIFVINLPSGGTSDASLSLDNILKQLDNVKNLDIIVVFTKFANFKLDVLNTFMDQNPDFEQKEQEEKDLLENKVLVESLKKFMKPFLERTFDNVNFFLYDMQEDLVWTNSDLSAIVNEMPESGSFYNISETPKEIKALIQKKSELAKTAISTKPSYFQTHIIKAAENIYAKCQNEFIEMSVSSSDNAVREEFAKVKQNLNQVHAKVIVEINDYLDDLFKEDGNLFQAFYFAQALSKDFDSFENSNLQIMSYITDQLNKNLYAYKTISSGLYPNLQKYLEYQFISKIFQILEKFQGGTNKQLKSTILSMKVSQLEKLGCNEIFQDFKKEERKKLIDMAEREFRQNFQLNINMCFDSKNNILEKMKKVVQTMKIRECLEYLKQAAQNPNFNNDYQVGFEDIVTSLSSSESEEQVPQVMTKSKQEEVESEWVALSNEINIETCITILGYNILKKIKGSKEEEFLINQRNEKQSVKMMFNQLELKQKLLKDTSSILNPNTANVLIFAYDLHDVSSLKIAFELYNQLKPFITKAIPYYLLGVTKENLSVNTIQDIQQFKVFKQAVIMAKAEEGTLLHVNHHIIDQRGVRYLQEILSKKQRVNEDFRKRVLVEESERLTSLFGSLSSKPFVISLVNDISEQILALFEGRTP